MVNSVTDFLIRIKNGYRAGCKSISSPSSKMREDIASLMKKYGYVQDYSVTEDVKKVISVNLNYDGRTPRLTDLKILSKPGRRIYEKSGSLPWGKTNDSLIIISTSAGLMSQKEAAAKHLGGEVIAEIW